MKRKIICLRTGDKVTDGMSYLSSVVNAERIVLHYFMIDSYRLEEIPLHPQKREEAKMIEKIDLVELANQPNDGRVIRLYAKVNELVTAVNELKANNPKGNE